MFSISRVFFLISAIDQGKLLNEMQSEKDTEDMLKCLPTLTINDIPMTLPKYDGVNHIDIKNIKGMSSVQPTNEVVYFKLRLNTDVLDQTEQEILPLLSMVLTCMGAGDKTYREMDTLMELHTGLFRILHKSILWFVIVF